MLLPPVCLLGGRTRTPFAGHFRGGVQSPAGVSLAWAGALHSAAGVEEAWGAAQAARAALAGLDACWETNEDAVTSGHAALTALPARWLSRKDLCVLLIARTSSGAVARAAGLSEVWALSAGSWGPLVGLGSEAGEWTFPTAVRGERWVGVPSGARFSEATLEASCGVRA